MIDHGDNVYELMYNEEGDIISYTIVDGIYITEKHPTKYMLIHKDIKYYGYSKVVYDSDNDEKVRYLKPARTLGIVQSQGSVNPYLSHKLITRLDELILNEKLGEVINKL